MTVPLVRQFTLDVTSLAASADFSAPMGRAPYACVVTLVEYIPAATQTDDDVIELPASTPVDLILPVEKIGGWLVQLMEPPEANPAPKHQTHEPLTPGSSLTRM